LLSHAEREQRHLRKKKERMRPDEKVRSGTGGGGDWGPKNREAMDEVKSYKSLLERGERADKERARAKNEERSSASRGSTAPSGDIDGGGAGSLRERGVTPRRGKSCQRAVLKS